MLLDSGFLREFLMANELKTIGSFGLLVERLGPILLSAATAGLLIYFKAALLSEAAANRFQPANLYTAVFSWSSIQVGFAFGVYGFILTKSDGFVGAVRHSVAMRRFIAYVRRGTIGGFLLTILSVPIAAVSPDFASSKACYYILTVWFSLFVWTFLAFLRIAYNFGRLSIVPDREPFYGA